VCGSAAPRGRAHARPIVPPRLGDQAMISSNLAFWARSDEPICFQSAWRVVPNGNSESDCLSKVHQTLGQVSKRRALPGRLGERPDYLPQILSGEFCPDSRASCGAPQSGSMRRQSRVPRHRASSGQSVVVPATFRAGPLYKVGPCRPQVRS